MKIEPIGDRVALVEMERTNTTPGGIVIPETVREGASFARVVAVGPGNGESPMQCREGDVMLANLMYAGVLVRVDGEPRVICRESEILAIVRDE